MADENTIIEGTVKFRDGKKWKSRWCVMSKLSPVADCVQLQVFRDARARAGGAASKAALSLQQFVGVEAGFTLDKHSHTLALVCRDLTAVLAFETRERLMQWQVKVSAQLGSSRQYVVVCGGRRAGPARLHVRGRRAALTAGAPPKLLELWDLPLLRRYGVVEGRLWLEAGARCGASAGTHSLLSDRAQDIVDDFDQALRETRGLGSPSSHREYRAGTRLTELASTPGDVDEAEGRAAADAACGRWAAADGDSLSVAGGEAGGGRVSLERCSSCMAKLGALSRSSTAATFSPAWTMDASPLAPSAPLPPPAPLPGPRPPARPPKPTHLELRPHCCDCSRPDAPQSAGSRIGPYENYDVPRLPSAEVEGEYYDTPKRLKECLNNELFRITKSSTMNSLILKKPCGCLLKVGKKVREPTIIDADENLQPASCPCQRVTAWANNWIKLPYCKKTTMSSDNLVPNKENMMPNSTDRSALYATIDFTRKTRRKSRICENDPTLTSPRPNDLRIDARSVEIDEGPLANYENLNFALSLEHYENAKDLLRKAGVTQSELDAISANLKPAPLPAASDDACAKCGQHQGAAGAGAGGRGGGAGDDYLMMEPTTIDNKTEQQKPPAGYTPMSPIGLGFHTLKNPARGLTDRLLEEKSASNPALSAPAAPPPPPAVEYRKRSCSADSSRFLEDVKEFEGSVGSGSSLETLRDAAHAGGAGRGGEAAGAACACAAAAPANRDSSSSNDSGVSSWSLRRFELPPTTAAARRHYRSARRAAAAAAPPPRRCRSTDPLRSARAPPPAAKCCSAEAEVPVLGPRPLRGVVDTHSTSSGASDMSDYIETLSICSSHSSSDTPVTMRVVRAPTSTLRPRSGQEYQNLPRHCRAHLH